MNPLIVQCIERLSMLTGIQFDRCEDVGTAILERISELGLVRPEQYLDLLSSESNLRRESEVLAPRITVPETYFFRDPGQLSALTGWLRQSLLRSGTTQVRVWSAGCSTGEEPYTLGILLEELRSTVLGLDYEIIATDLNPASLAVARAGRYFGRSIKGVEQNLLDRYFVRDDGTFQVAELIRSRVSFCWCNLTDWAGPGLADLPPDLRDGCDLVLCRNVLIYFSGAAVRSVLNLFYRALRPGGILFLGHSEALGAISSTPFVPLRMEGTFGYEKVLAPRLPTRTGAPEHRKAPALRRGPTPKVPGRSAARAPVPSEPGPQTAAELIDQARAARGHSDHAATERVCRVLIERLPLESEAYRLLYESRQDRGDLQGAQRVIEKLLFLEPGDAAARYNLARCLIKTGDLARGERELKNVLEATKNAVLDTPVPGADGLSYRALRQMCEQGCGRGRRGG